MFDGSLGTYTSLSHTIGLKEDAKLHHSKPISKTNIHKSTLKKEHDRLIKIGVLKKINYFQKAASTFIIWKINQTVRFLSDFRELNA